MDQWVVKVLLDLHEIQRYTSTKREVPIKAERVKENMYLAYHMHEKKDKKINLIKLKGKKKEDRQ